MLSLFYKKNDNRELFKDIELSDIKNTQSFIPIYNKYFSLSEQNYNKINLNHHYHIKNIKSIEGEKNKFNCIIECESQKKNSLSFFKFSPLLDPIRYMLGKYNALTDEKQQLLPKLKDNKCHSKLIDPNNSAYVDSFFSFLSSKLLHQHKIPHCIDFFGSFLGIKKNFSINIFDDLDYLCESNFFLTNSNTKFKITNLDGQGFIQNLTKNNMKKLKISDNSMNFQVDKLEINFDSLFLNSNNGKMGELELLDNSKNLIVNLDSINLVKHKSNSESSYCSSESSHTSNEHSDSNESDDSNASDSDTSYNSDSEDSDIEGILEAVLYDFPVQIICLECLDNTLDSHLNKTKQLTDNEWTSCLFQIIMTLIIYQKTFNLTHNDLHTNNIMYKKTDKQFLYYKFDNIHYKVPTHGKIYKIIDFGRAIYKYKGQQICSDSFHPKGDAATQYNCEPYFNEKKPRLGPNYSFDLCRLACSLYDYFVDDEEENIENPIAKLIIKWCTDDKGRNILYKKHGEERYPEFKLYKMIARTVHKYTPQTQCKISLFRKYITSRKQMNKRNLKSVINIDTLPSYTESE